MIIDSLLDELKNLKGVISIAIGGSRASGYADISSDYDVYVYYENPISSEDRLLILKKYCKQIECNNTFWETEDNCIMMDDIPIDIIYRNLKDFSDTLDRVVVQGEASNGYTTCLWHNLLHSTIVYDFDGKLKALQNLYDIAYPKALQRKIISKNSTLLDGYLPSYSDQIVKAIKREDLVSIQHRTTEFLASYFDIIFALNKMTHPGEKRLLSICKKECRILPKNFEKNLNLLFEYMFKDKDVFKKILFEIILEIKNTIKEEGFH
jgi:Phosphatidylinositol kinase and protein kinases of the PI-3 kinase family